MKRQILLISYKFPPISGPRSLRWVQLIKYLVEKGYKVDVVTIAPEKGLPMYDEDISHMIPKGVRIFRTYPGPMHTFIYRYLSLNKQIKRNSEKINLKAILRQWLRAVFKKAIEPLLIPDKMIEWLPWGLKILRKLKKENEYDLVISSGMPFTSHILGYCFKKWARIAWIAAYGDPWVFNPISYRWRYYIDKQIEGRLLKEVDHIIVTTEETAKGFTKHYPFLESKKIDIVSQGYNRQIYQETPAEKGKCFRIIYTGIFYSGVREPYTFFEAIRDLKDLNLEVVVAGDILPCYVRWVEEKQLSKKIVFLGHQKHRKAVALQKGADVLLSFGWPDGYQVPGKIFEYFAACRPILSIKYDDKDIAARLVNQHKRGIVVSNKKKNIVDAITQLYSLKRSGQIEKSFDLSSPQEYTWRAQADKLEKVIKNFAGYNG